MKLFGFLIGIFFTVFALSPTAQARLWQSAQTLPKRHLTMGAYAEVLLPPNGGGGFLQTAYGLTHDTQIEARIGGSSLGFYGGGFATFRLVRVEPFHFATLVGLHHEVVVSIDWSIIGSFDFERFRIYLAPILNGAIGQPLGIAIVPGLAWIVPVAKEFAFEFYAEGQINLTGLYHSGSLGLKTRFNLE